jgi:hypothetical protein
VRVNIIEVKVLLTLACLEDKRDTLPPWVVDPDGGGSKSGTDGVRRDGTVLEISGLAVRRNILAEKGVATLNGWDSP